MLLFLHGWGKSKGDYQELLDLTGAEFIDLPGFEIPLERPFNLDDYSNWLNTKISGKVTLITHSFGGGVAIKFAIAHPEKVNKLVLIASRGIERKNLKIKILNYLAKGIPQIIKNRFSKLFGSADYNNANGFLKETLKKVVAENLEFILPKVKVPTLIIWGSEDHTTPLWHGQLMHKLIPRSGLAIITGGDHGIPYRRAKEVTDLICKFC